MSRLQNSILAGRQLLDAPALMEANAARKPLLDTANHWRSFIRMGDLYLEAVQGVVEAAERASQVEDGLAARRANADVSGAMKRVVDVTAKAYEHFAHGRTAMYEVAKLYGIQTKRPSLTGSKKPSSLTMLGDEDLRKVLGKSGARLGAGIRKMLDVGARTAKDFRTAAQSSEEVPLEQVKMLVSQGLDFRDSVSAHVFARTHGIMRRAAELSKRSWELMMMEDSKLGWVAPWARDPEIGDLEA